MLEPCSAGNVSTHSDAAAKLDMNVLRSGVPIPPSTYQCAPPGRKRERAPRRGADQPPVRVQRVEQGKQVVLVCAASVEKDKRAVRLCSCAAHAGGEAHA